MLPSTALVLARLLLQPTAGPATVPTLDLAWRAPAECPDAAAVTAMVSALLRRPADLDTTVARAAVTHDASGWRLGLDLHAGGSRYRRIVRADDCLVLARATALLIAWSSSKNTAWRPSDLRTMSSAASSTAVRDPLTIMGLEVRSGRLEYLNRPIQIHGMIVMNPNACLWASAKHLAEGPSAGAEEHHRAGRGFEHVLDPVAEEGPGQTARSLAIVVDAGESHRRPAKRWANTPATLRKTVCCWRARPGASSRIASWR